MCESESSRKRRMRSKHLGRYQENPEQFKKRVESDVGCCGYRDSRGCCIGGNACVTTGVVLVCFVLPYFSIPGLVLIVVGVIINNNDVAREQRDWDELVSEYPYLRVGQSVMAGGQGDGSSATATGAGVSVVS